MQKEPVRRFYRVVWEAILTKLRETGGDEGRNRNGECAQHFQTETLPERSPA